MPRGSKLTSSSRGWTNCVHYVSSGLCMCYARAMDSGVQDSGAPLYNTAAVVQRTGVPATTFRAWERRYGAPKPRRDARDQRLYSERDIQTIRWFSEQTSHGVAISRAVAMLRGGYAAFGNCSAPAVPSAARSFAALRTELLDA